MKVDDVVARYSRRKNFNLSLKLQQDYDERPYLLIEGNPKSLAMLGELLLAVSSDKRDEGFYMGPEGPGSDYFDATSELGVYIHSDRCPECSKTNAPAQSRKPKGKRRK